MPPSLPAHEPIVSLALQFCDRAVKFIGALAQFIQESRIFNGDDCLRSKIRDKRDLPVGKRAALFLAAQDECTN
jgi:hypothetical protein